MPRSRKAAVIYEAGSPEVLNLEQRLIPSPKAGQVLVRLEAFGLNRSELFTREGHSPGVEFPRILGIEATEEVLDAPGGEFDAGDVVVIAMGGLGRAFVGGYAEYTCPSASQVQKVTVNLPWDILGALPEILQTAYGALFTALQLQPEQVDDLWKQMFEGSLKIPLGKRFELDQIVEAHRCMEENKAQGKIVILTEVHRMLLGSFPNWFLD